jgi:hypothetical protein
MRLRLWVVVAFAALGALRVGSIGGILACSDKTLPAPTSDTQFDDSDEPATPGPIGASDATTTDSSVPCGSDIDCPQRVAHCFFPVAEGCNATGVCVSYEAPVGCHTLRFCDCQGGGVTACAPEGLSPIRVSPGAICPEIDAAPPPADASTDGTPE